MAQVNVTPGVSEIQLAARARTNKIPPPMREVPGGLYPMMSAAFEVDEYRIAAGWPVPVPDYSVTARVLVSGSGVTLGNRDSPLALLTGAALRWAADPSYWDEVSLQWTPLQGDCSPWSTTPEHAPVLVSDYEYRVGDERFVDMHALNFDSNTASYLANDLSLYLGGVSGYTVIMVLSPNSLYGNDPGVTEHGLWGPAALAGAWAYFTVSLQAVYLTTDLIGDQRGVSIGNALSATAPCYLALVVGRPQTTLYAAQGPSSMRVKSLAAGKSPEPLSAHFWLGNVPAAGVGSMDMALLDLGLYSNQLNKSEVAAEFAKLSSVYGGDT